MYTIYVSRKSKKRLTIKSQKDKESPANIILVYFIEGRLIL
jgi:hypothetical protein